MTPSRPRCSSHPLTPARTTLRHGDSAVVCRGHGSFGAPFPKPTCTSGCPCPHPQSVAPTQQITLTRHPTPSTGWKLPAFKDRSGLHGMSSFSKRMSGRRRCPVRLDSPPRVTSHRTLRARYGPPAAPVYAVGVPVHLHQQAVVALDPLRQRQVGPMESLSPVRVRAITGRNGVAQCQPPSATAANLRAVIHLAAATVPVHVLPE